MTQPGKRGGLGRGLGALIPQGPAPDTAATDDTPLAPVQGARFAELPLGSITPNPVNPRVVFDADELAELVGSIKEVGLLQPVVVRPVGSESGTERYELIMGERRWRAAQEAGLATIPAIVRETADDVMLRDALLENLHRSQLNPLEEAAAYAQLLQDFGATHEELATRIHRSRPQISNTLRLLNLPPAVQSKVAAGVLSAGHAKAILGLATPEAMDALAHRVVAEGMSVRSTEEAVALAASEAPHRKRGGAEKRLVPEQAREVADWLADRFQTRVKVDVGRSRGRITIEFATLEDLQRIAGIVREGSTE
ncbi:MAG TPA: ParB/RepB/Spo0J family partition protein [Mycobacteriales bacterium]|nr:ParB/RepB/Spo0J family partition protein [Mycobacteriales bacterium]